MTTVHTVLLIAHVVIACLMVGAVLLQRGKGAEAGAAFGSGASGTVFGARGSANFLSRTTAILATLFFVTSLTLAYMASQRPTVGGSIMQDSAPVSAPEIVPAPVEQSDLPAAPAPAEIPAE